MLFCYFDESGEHDGTTGHLTRLTIAGGLAKVDTWQEIDVQWNEALEDEGIGLFHMKDFEGNRGEFVGWSRERHLRFISRLFDIFVDRIHCIGISFKVVDQRKALGSTYAECMAQAVNAACTLVHLGLNQEELSLVFARHGEFSIKRIEEVCKKIRPHVQNLKECVSDEPIRSSGLQVADIIAYEISHMRTDSKMREPLRRLLTGPKFLHINR